MIPDERQSLLLHSKYGSDDRIVRHCQAVARLSAMVASTASAKGIALDERAMVAAALLHDIGRNKTHLVSHGYIGAQILEQEGVDRVVVEIVRKHVGAGISQEEAARLGFPGGMEYVPRTLEEKIVCFCDKMLDGDVARPLDKEVARFVRKGHDVERLIRLRDDVAQALGEDPEKVLLGGS